MHFFSFPFFLGINNIKYSANNYKGLILSNYRFSLINSLSIYYFISINLYIKKNLKFIFSFRLIA